MSEMHEYEQIKVRDQHGVNGTYYRLRVKDGWIYTTYTDSGVTSCFVPDAAVGFATLEEERLYLCKLHESGMLSTQQHYDQDQEAIQRWEAKQCPVKDPGYTPQEIEDLGPDGRAILLRQVCDSVQGRMFEEYPNGESGTAEYFRNLYRREGYTRALRLVTKP